MACRAGSYRTSHDYPGKAAEYDAGFKTRYREYLWLREQAMLRRILDKYHPHGGFNCLDFACGTGRILVFLEQVADRITGLDVAEEMLGVARSKISKTRLIRGDITRDPVLGDERFDVITAFRFFLNAEQTLREEVMQALAPRLTDDGIFVFNNHMNHSSLAGVVTRVNNRLRRGTNNTWRIRDMRSLVERCGLEIVEVYHEGVMLGWERFMLLPAACYHMIDGLTSRIGFLHHVAQDVIFVCKRAGAN